jgi:hypothetical protein
MARSKRRCGWRTSPRAGEKPRHVELKRTGFETEDEAIHPDLAAEVSSGRSTHGVRKAQAVRASGRTSNS